eukprot:CAMPEP_0195301948 /NCGR_PEP_ID=MMETSP0707-20130614/30238_1 /TAXON_ID=33640 /ORGANISM="Asterionellopsis glacialis, Strain CCMP134" /LENGTH=260 /DNA_ID=CAMNT_0040365063 /DNA_START=328 /DNA_END=1107 /DNA_ORIENTATION=+
MCSHDTTIEDQIEEARLELELLKFERQQKLVAQKNEFQILRDKRDMVNQELIRSLDELDPRDVRVYVSTIRDVRHGCELPPVVIALEAQLLEALLHGKVLYKQLQLAATQSRQYMRAMQGMLLRATDDKAANDMHLMNSMQDFFDKNFKVDAKDSHGSKHIQAMHLSDGSINSSPSLDSTVDSEITAMSNEEEQHEIMARILSSLEIVCRANTIQSTRSRAIVRNAQLNRNMVEAKLKQFLRSRSKSEDINCSLPTFITW